MRFLHAAGIHFVGKRSMVSRTARQGRNAALLTIPVSTMPFHLPAMNLIT
jgi:hypothetical protein